MEQVRNFSSSAPRNHQPNPDSKKVSVKSPFIVTGLCIDMKNMWHRNWLVDVQYNVVGFYVKKNPLEIDIWKFSSENDDNQVLYHYF